MPNLKTFHRWHRFEPDLPGNRREPGQDATAHPPAFFFEVAGDLTKVEFSELQRKLDVVDEFPSPPPGETAEAAVSRVAGERAEAIKRTAAALGDYVRLGSEPLVLDGVAVSTLEQYLIAVSAFQSLGYAAELSAAVARVNTVGGSGFFSERLSGGFTSTRARRNG